MMLLSGNKKILVVEDEAVVALDLERGVRSFGYDVVGRVHTAEDAIVMAQEKKPDLVLMDIALKGKGDGIYAATELGRSSSIPVIFLTGMGDEATLQRAKLANPFGYVLKPFDHDELRIAIELALYRAERKEVVEQSEVSLEDAQLNPFVSMTDQSSPETLQEFFWHLRLFRDIPNEILAKVAEYSTIKELTAGSCATYGAEHNSYFGIVVRGRVAIVHCSMAGKELVVGLIGPGECFGLRLVSGVAEDQMVARSQTDSKILVISVPIMRALLKESAQLSINLSQELAWRLKHAEELASSLAHSKVEDRIISTLLTLIPNFGKSSSQGPAVRIFLTRKELADLTGTTPETAIRVTKNLEREGHLDLTRPGIIKILDPHHIKQALLHVQ